MKRFFETLKNIWTIEDLRVRIINTLGLLLIYRLGSYIVLPGVNSAALEAANAGNTGGIAGLLDLFAGGAFSRASIFALGIMPYISASIVVQLLGIAIPYFQKLQKEGESGRRRINQITRMLTIIIVGFQAPGYIASQVPELAAGGVMVRPDTLFWWITTVIILITGTMFVMWLGERITEKGLGNGISLIIMIGIIANLPFAFVAEFASRIKGGGLVILLVELVLLLLVIIATILLVQGTRRVPVQFAKRVVGNKQYGGVRQYIPLKVNAAGVMPIIFAQAIMFIPITLAGFANSDSLTGLTAALSDYTGFWYNLIFGLMIIAFTYFYTAVTVNPNQMAEDMKKNGGFVPGVKPGKKTAEFLDTILSRITLPGSIFLAIVAVLPAFASKFGVNGQFAQFFGGTSLLIMVGVVLDTLQQVESHLLMRHYDGLMKTGRIKGRSSINMAG
ncbi:MAG: preprotein translocase subunit SecY [Bacteroidetes bacterium]|nr:MAG: preprotein translocase subunit SecY [Bacteroidota bacterium]MBL1145963.1 preprotein translocase subunit SecY [Bacteroidota bacterium]MCB0803261.1 preprotein translocase subunit SecY [Flavobacteriales bacterium]NOG58757.1 preprotein translocase subunit SecY [Bacteroidota bacterium]